jgi:DNA-binding transcriptional regulator YhcF (GntR family)
MVAGTGHRGHAMNAANSALKARHARASGNSYKFQRLREELRLVVRSGELSGKLPGERILARRFKANAKTLSKALTDLAAEGLLERIIGRGTFVKGTLSPSNRLGRWLLLSDSSEKSAALTEAISAINPDNQSIHEVAGVRPSFLGQFSAVIDLSSQTPEAFLRDLAVRNMPIVLANREPGTLSLHAVLMDIPLGGARLAREMLLLGHRHFLVVERHGSAVLAKAVQSVATRYDPHATVDTCAPDESASVLDSRATAIIATQPRPPLRCAKRSRAQACIFLGRSPLLLSGSAALPSPPAATTFPPRHWRPRSRACCGIRSLAVRPFSGLMVNGSTRTRSSRFSPSQRPKIPLLEWVWSFSSEAFSDPKCSTPSRARGTPSARIRWHYRAWLCLSTIAQHHCTTWSGPTEYLWPGLGRFWKK